jgi:hypothetical protein
MTDKRYYLHDSIRLADGVVLGEEFLEDKATGAQVALNSMGRRVVELISEVGEVPLSAVAEYLTQTADVDLRTAEDDSLQLVASLDAAGVIQVTGADSVFVGVIDAVKTRGLSLATFDVVRLARGGRRRRYKPTAVGLARAVIRSQGVVAVLGLLVCVVLGVVMGFVYGATDFLNLKTVETLAIAPAVIGLTHVAVLFVHEYAHLVGARTLGLAPRFVVSEGRSLGIRREAGGRAANAFVAVAGPLAAAGTAMIAVVLVQTWHAGFWLTDPWGMASSCLAFYALGHLACLLPIAGDGKNLLRSIGGPGADRAAAESSKV